ncbi:EKC/KEOPS complex subunit Tp53rk isoform X3 [Temnothorax curvispinosus]|uniref:non-specific serine/threonine protein kinase n=1 Tax=Temnothorax curvispinosus TaxID=300111 RepID=A0A6J1QT27_9HYME|nr:EKC/KEOPS complex subunit Tp53rk isoform X3 [Temnothorax curvispinosus]
MTMKDSELIAQGAEARLYKGLYLGKTCLMKERFVKNYRHPELDARLTKDRIRAEARAIIRAKSAGIATPALYLVDLERRSIYMEYVENATVLKEFIEKKISGKADADRLVDFIGRGLGTLIAETQFVMIDFGLARVDSTLEDKAVDLYVLERSLLSAHSEVPTLFSRIFHHYQQHYQNKNQCEQVLARYKQVQERGRKRLMVG